MYKQLKATKEAQNSINARRAINTVSSYKHSFVDKRLGLFQQQIKDNRMSQRISKIRAPKDLPLQLKTSLKWNKDGKFIAKNKTNPEKIVQILNQLKGSNIIDFQNVDKEFKNAHVIAACFGGAQTIGNLVSWGDQMEEKQGDFEKTIMNGGANSSEANWKGYPSGGANEQGELDDNYAVGNGGLDASVRTAWTNKVKTLIKVKADGKFVKLGKDTVSDRPSDGKIDEEVMSLYDKKVKGSFNAAVSRLPTAYELAYEPDADHNPKNRKKINSKLAKFPSLSLNEDEPNLYQYLSPFYVKDEPQKWRVAD